MSQYVTIKKLAEDVGIDPSSVRLLLKNGVLTRHTLEGMKRIFIDIDEFNSKIKKETVSPVNDIDMTAFKI